MATVSRIDVQVGAKTKDLKQGLGTAKKEVSGFASSIGKLVPAMAAAFAVKGIVRYASAAMKAADVQLQAENQLLVALKGRADIQKSLIKQAGDLQKKTLFGDEETIKAQSLIAAFTKEEAAIKKVIPLVQDLASAKGMQLAGAADLVSKTLGSSTNALSRYGIEVTGAVGSTERLETLTQGLTKAFGGQAEAAAQVGMGPMVQLKNATGDLAEEIGKGLLPVMGALATGFTNITVKATEWLAAQNKITNAESLTWWEKLGAKILGVNSAVGIAAQAVADMDEENKAAIETAKALETEQQNKLITLQAEATALIAAKAAMNSYNVDLLKGTELNRGWYQGIQDVVPLIQQGTLALHSMNAALVRNQEIRQEMVDDKAFENQYVTLNELWAAGAEQQGLLGDLAVQMGNSMVQAAAVGGAGLKGLARAAANAGKQIIAAFLAETIAGAVKSAMTSVPFPYNIALAGAAGAGAAALFNAIVPSFAMGGGAYQPTMAMIGDHRGASRYNPEAVLSLRQIERMVGGGGGATQIEGIMRGNDLYWVNSKQENRILRVTG